MSSSDRADALPARVERAFTCTTCGFATTYEVDYLQSEVRAVCVNCGDWTAQLADERELIEAARRVAESLAGSVLTERQAQAYVLRDVLGVDRRTAARALGCSPSNVDNLLRRARGKVEDAERVVAGLDAVRPDDRDETGE